MEKAGRRKVNEYQIRVGCRALNADAAIPSSDIQSVRAVAPTTRIADRGVIAQSPIWVLGPQRHVDFFRRKHAAVAIPVWMRQIVRGTLIPEHDETSGAVRIDEIRVSKVQPEVQRRDDASSAFNWRGSAKRHFRVLMPRKFHEILCVAGNTQGACSLQTDHVAMLTYVPDMRREESTGKDSVESRNNLEMRRNLSGILQAKDPLDHLIGVGRFHSLCQRGI